MPHPPARPAPRHRFLAAAVVATCGANGAFAVDYSAGGQVRLDVLHNDNLQLTESSLSATERTTSVEFNGGANSERTGADLAATLRSRRYSESGFDSDDQLLRGNLVHAFPRSSVGLRVAAVRDSTLTSELLDSGRTSDAARHEQYSIAPSWSYQLGERDLISLQADYIDSRYHGDGYVDYDYFSTSLLWTHNLGERTRTFLQGSHGRYESAARAFAFGQSHYTKSRDTGIQLGGEYQISEGMSLSILAGATRNRTEPRVDDPLEFCPLALEFGLVDLFPLCALETSSATLTTLDGSLTWRNPRHELAARVARRTQPSSNGYLQESNQLNLDWRYRLRERGTLSLNLILGTTDVPSPDAVRAFDPSRDYGYATLRYAHALGENWSLDCSYRYQAQQYESRERIDAHSVSIGITWKARERHWSR